MAPAPARALPKHCHNLAGAGAAAAVSPAVGGACPSRQRVHRARALASVAGRPPPSARSTMGLGKCSAAVAKARSCWGAIHTPGSWP